MFISQKTELVVGHGVYIHYSQPKQCYSNKFFYNNKVFFCSVLSSPKRDGNNEGQTVLCGQQSTYTLNAFPLIKASGKKDCYQN